MKTIILILLSLSAHADQTMKPLQHIQDELQANFTYIDQQGVEDLQQFPTGDVPFIGDCDDYYSAAFNQLWQFNYDPFTLILAAKQGAVDHIVACVVVANRTRCLDNQRSVVSSLRDIKQYYTIEQRLYTK